MNTTLHDSTRKPLFPRGPGLALNFFLLALLSLALMVSDAQSDRFALARGWMSWALQPVLWIAESPQKLWRWGDNFGNRDELVEENRHLKQKQLELQARLLKLDALEAENERIRALLSSAASLEDRVLIAEIFSVNQDPNSGQILLNRGERDGVYKGQALLDANGVMGYVIQVNPTTCMALLITDPAHGTPVEINRTGLQTIANGRGPGQGLSLPFLPGNADVKVGDLLVTSGIGGRFPAGYPVGEIYELRHPAGENFMEALAYPSAKIDQGRQALLVWSDTPVQMPQETMPDKSGEPNPTSSAKPQSKLSVVPPKPFIRPHNPAQPPTEVPRAQGAPESNSSSKPQIPASPPQNQKQHPAATNSSTPIPITPPQSAPGTSAAVAPKPLQKPATSASRPSTAPPAPYNAAPPDRPPSATQLHP